MRRYFEIFIDILFITALFIALFGIYKLVVLILQKIPDLSATYGSLISACVSLIIAIVSATTKIKNYLLILRNKIQQSVYRFFSWNHNPLSCLTIVDFNSNSLLETEEQGKFVNSAIRILKNNLQNLILISGYPGRGKTTSIMLLLSAIAHDKELYWIFTELQNQVVYFDSVSDKESLLNYLNHTGNPKCKLIIIDNIHKYSISSINEIMGRLNNFFEYNQTAHKKILIILLYQKTKSPDALYEYIKNNFFSSNDNIFKLEKNINLDTTLASKKSYIDFEVFKKNISKVEDTFFQQHLRNILYNRKDDSIISFLNDLLFTQSNLVPPNDQKKFFVLIAVVFIGLYNGYVTRKELRFLWRKRYSHLSLPQEWLWISYYVRNRLLTPFPFIRSSYIFNEHLAREYRKKLMFNNFYRQESDAMAQNMFLYCKEDNPQKWLLFLICSVDYCKNFPQNQRIQYFENSLSEYHLQYILDLVETEISIIKEKEEIFRQELGIIYIYNGEWARAKQIVYPYVQNYDVNKDIWHIQIRIIEAEHGGDDKDYLDMLTCMQEECTDPIVLFQVKYWQEHICMEHGNFSLNTWKKLVQEIMTDDNLEELRRNKHFLARVISDYERTYFLKGDINYPVYKEIISNYKHLYSVSTEPIECTLSRAYYIQYDILFQLGIWGYTKYDNIAPNIMHDLDEPESEEILKKLIEDAQSCYNQCINKYQSEGEKKYRTISVRKAELSLCTDTNQYISILNEYKNFEQYEKRNNITVFDGYCATQKGKAFALYADYMFRHNDIDRFTEFLGESKKFLKDAQTTYKRWGNTYGVLRAELLEILVDMIQQRDRTQIDYMDRDTYRNEYSNRLSKLSRKYDLKRHFLREDVIVEYLQENILKMDIPLRILKYYPIILQ